MGPGFGPDPPDHKAADTVERNLHGRSTEPGWGLTQPHLQRGQYMCPHLIVLFNGQLRLDMTYK